MQLPFYLLLVTEVSLESLLAPLTVNGVTDGGKRGNAFVFLRVLEELFMLLAKVQVLSHH